MSNRKKKDLVDLLRDGAGHKLSDGYEALEEAGDADYEEHDIEHDGWGWSVFDVPEDERDDSW